MGREREEKKQKRERERERNGRICWQKRKDEEENGKSWLAAVRRLNVLNNGKIYQATPTVFPKRHSSSRFHPLLSFFVFVSEAVVTRGSHVLANRHDETCRPMKRVTSKMHS